MFRFHTASHHPQSTRRLLVTSLSSVNSSNAHQLCCSSPTQPKRASSSSALIQSAVSMRSRSTLQVALASSQNTSSESQAMMMMMTSSAVPNMTFQSRAQSGGGNPMMDKNFQCSACQKTFRLISTAGVHVRNVHSGDAKILDLVNGGVAVVDTSVGGGAPSMTTPNLGNQPPRQSFNATVSPTTNNNAAPPIQPQQQAQQASSASSPPLPSGGGSIATAAGAPRVSRFSPINTSSSTASRGGAFPTLNPSAGMNGSGLFDSRSETEDRFKREIRRGKSIKDPIYKPTVEMAQEQMDEMMEVWDKYGVMRLKEKYFKYSDREKAYAAKKMVEDETIPTYETAMDENGTKINPFAELESVDDVKSATKSSSTAQNQKPQQQEQTSSTTTTTTASAASETTAPSQKTETTTSSISDIVYAIGTSENVSPFICASVENPLITYPQPPEKPQVKRQRSAGSPAASASSSSSRLQQAGNEDDDSMMNIMNEDGSNNSGDSMMMNSGADDEGGDSSSSSMMKQHQDSTFDPNEASPFAQAMQATSPFSISEQSAPIDHQQQVASPFAQAAASSSPFGSFDPSSSSQQQQVQSPFGQQMQMATSTTTMTTPSQQPQQILSPFADLMTSTQQQQAMMQQQQQMSTQPYQASSTGAPLTPIEAAVDLSALFGAPSPHHQQDGSSSQQQQQQQELFMCKICGKNTFKSEFALITHCQEKHGVNVAADLAKNSKSNLEAGVSPTGRKKVRQLPDLPPYIPTPVDLAATSPYGATRQRGTTTAFWSEVEVSPHARMMSSITLLGEVEKIINNKATSTGTDDDEQQGSAVVVSTVLGKPCLQFSLHIHESEYTEEEKFVVRCFGDDLIRHLRENVKLEEGSSVFVEGLLRLNPSYDAALKRYQANPAIHVALPNGFVQRLD